MNKNASVRERIGAIQKELLAGALTPDMARESLVVLTALLGNVNDECREADIEYALILSGCYRAEDTANRAKIAARSRKSLPRQDSTNPVSRIAAIPASIAMAFTDHGGRECSICRAHLGAARR